MNSSNQKLAVGQTLWYVPNSRRSEPCEITIAKVGRKWATANIRGRDERIDMETLRVDAGGYTSPGTCWLTKADHEASQALEEAWNEFYQLVDRQYSVPAGVTINQIENAKRSLFKGAK